MLRIDEATIITSCIGCKEIVSNGEIDAFCTPLRRKGLVEVDRSSTQSIAVRCKMASGVHASFLRVLVSDSKVGNHGVAGRSKGRQTDSFNWDTNPHTPRLYFKPAPPLHLPRYSDLQGLHQLIMDVEKYYASPAGSRRLMAPPVKCGESRCSDVYH